jgi:hypothetical protein
VQFYPFLDVEHAKLPELAPGDYRVVTFVGSLQEDQLIPGPAFDTSRLDDIHAVLMLLGVAFDALRTISHSDSGSSRGVWLSFEPITALTPGIVFAIENAAAREFLLDLNAAAEMMKSFLPQTQGGCALQVVLPGSFP